MTADDQVKAGLGQFGYPGAVGGGVGFFAFRIPDDTLISGHNRANVNWIALGAAVIVTVIVARMLHEKDELRLLLRWAGGALIAAVLALLVCIGVNASLGRAFSPESPFATFLIRGLWQGAYVILIASVGALGWCLWRIAEVFRKKPPEAQLE